MPKKLKIEEILEIVRKKKAARTAKYVKKLAELAPSVEVKAGITFSSSRSGKTLTINPGLLNKMQHDPEQAKATMDMIKGVEMLTKWLDGFYKAAGRTLVYRNSYIDENGKFYSFSYVKDERSYQMSIKLQKARWGNAQKLTAKIKKNAEKKKKDLQKKLEEKRTAKAEEKSVQSGAGCVTVQRVI